MTKFLADPREIVVATASDDNYAIGMAVTIRSTIHNLSPDRRLRVYVLDGGITDETKARVLRSWQDPRVRIEWIRPDMKLLEGLITIGHLNLCTYLRLLMPHVLPADLGKVIYLDADLLIRRDIAEMWDEPLGERPALAAVEVAAPYVDCATVFQNDPDRYKAVPEVVAVKNFRELGIPGERKFFNAGVLVVNLDRWRRDNIPQQAMDCLHVHREYVLWCDEYALNVVMSGEWGELDARWNQGAAFNSYPCWQESPFDKVTYQRIKDDPWIIHFTWIKKPWLADCTHPFKEEFLTYLDKTDWRGHRPVTELPPTISLQTRPAQGKPFPTFRDWWRTKKDKYRSLRKSIRVSSTASRTFSDPAVAMRHSSDDPTQRMNHGPDFQSQ